MNKKIIALGHEASLSGAPKLFLELLIELKKQDFEIIIFLKTGGPLLADFSELGKVYLLDSLHKKNSKFLKLLIRFLPFYKIRDLHLKVTFSRYSPCLILNYTLVNSKLFSYLNRIKAPMLTVAQEMKSVVNLFDRLQINESKLVFDRTSYFITCSKAVKEDLVKVFKVNKNKVKVIYNSVSYYSLEGINNNNTLEQVDEDFYVGMCGGPIHRKGPDLFLNTAKYINENYNNQNIKFIWQGGSENTSAYQDFMNEIELLRLNNVVQIIPSKKNVQSFFSKINLFLCSSREEPFGMVILEAGLNNIPSLAFEKSGGPEEILANHRGLIVPYGSFKKMAEAIVELKNNKSLMSKYSKNLNNYSIKNHKKNNNLETIKIIEKIIS